MELLVGKDSSTDTHYVLVTTKYQYNYDYDYESISGPLTFI